MDKLFLYYKRLSLNQSVCILGALTSDINTLNESMRLELLNFTHTIINWITIILKEGQDQLVFKPIINTELKAKLLITTLMSIVQIARIEQKDNSINEMIDIIIDELIIK